jgi:tetratricopeptide (TPR) repeat protein
MGRYDGAIKSCSDSLTIDNDFVEALNIRGDLYLKKEMFEEAVRDFENAHRLDPNNHSINENLGKARLELKKSQRKDYYKILGVSKNADEATIKKAYRKGALKYHPDKQVGLTAEEQQNAENMFKDVAEAYEILSNAEKRQRYDNGEDLMEQQQGFNPFQGGGFPFPFGGQGGNFQFHFKFN